MRNGGAVHFVILSGEKRRMLANGLSETGELSRNQVRSEELGVRSEGTAHKMRKRRKVLYNEVVLGTI